MPDPSPLEKLDISLNTALRAYEESRDARDANAGISVTLRFEGDLAPIEALGFETHSVWGDQALGVVRFKDIPALVAHPGVLWLAAGRRPKPDLDTAVDDINARATFPIGSTTPADGLWHAVVATGAFTSTPDATGKGVIVAIIDTGIDYTHPMFLSQLTPDKKSRILRIWDQGLVPTAMTECPDVGLLASLNTYGVEFKTPAIEAALNGGTPLPHRDCDGHGTHVAGIAAGGTLFPTGGDASKVGVAPEADIIAVKVLDVPDKIVFRLPPSATAGTDVDWPARFRDAVLYCLRTARVLSKPVVINLSFGDIGKPGDGLDDEARFVDDLMDPTKPPGGINFFPKGAVIVKSGGNIGNAADRLVARIEVPSSGEITVPFLLEDNRGSTQTEWQQCAQRLYAPAVGVHFWYRRAAAPLSVKFALKTPHGASFGGNAAVGGKFEIGFRHHTSPTVADENTAASSAVHRAGIEHENNPPAAYPPHPTGGTVHRHHVYFSVQPKVSGSTVTYDPGIYEIRIQAPAGTVIHAVCEEEFWGALRVFFAVAKTMADTSLLHGNIQVTNESSAPDTMGQHVITVAAYDEAAFHDIWFRSSRGPLRDFSDPPGSKPLIASKPDIAAPGFEINSAEGVDTEALLPRGPAWTRGVRFTEHTGTSMAAPMVTGVIALMLDKKPDLSTTDVRGFLAAAARAAVNPGVPPASTRAYGSGMVDALQTHTDTH